MDEIIFNIVEVADYLKCSPTTIRRLAKKQRIPFFRIGKKYNFNKKIIDNWIYQQSINNIN